jgi:hypothetical protein
MAYRVHGTMDAVEAPCFRCSANGAGGEAKRLKLRGRDDSMLRFC